jgi:hypothetical protein
MSSSEFLGGTKLNFVYLSSHQDDFETSPSSMATITSTSTLGYIGIKGLPLCLITPITTSVMLGAAHVCHTYVYCHTRMHNVLIFFWKSHVKYCTGKV